jgi:hypothetical protein
MELLHRRKHGDIVGDINRRRGQVNDMGDRAGAKLLRQMCHYQKWVMLRH